MLSGRIDSSKREPGTSVLSIRLTARRSKADVNVYLPSSIDFHQSIESVLLKQALVKMAKNVRKDIQREVWACRLHVALDSSTHGFLPHSNENPEWPTEAAGSIPTRSGYTHAHTDKVDSAQERRRRVSEASWKPQHGVDKDDFFFFFFEQGSTLPTEGKGLFKPAKKSLQCFKR